MKLILGIDPGSRLTGFGLIRIVGKQIEYVTHGVIQPPVRFEFSRRIAIIGEELEVLLRRFSPHDTVIERIFLGKNSDSAFKLGHARGVAMASAARAGSQIVEYAPRAVKKGITGNGGATKEQVASVLYRLLFIASSDAPIDASDALSLAYHHGSQLVIQSTLRKTGEMTT